MSEQRRLELIDGLLALNQLLLMLVTLPLWSGTGVFPSVPLIPWHLPGWLLPAASVVIAVNCFRTVISVAGCRAARGFFNGRLWSGILLAVALIPPLQNVHCLQAWYWFFLLVTAIRCTGRQQRQRTAIVMVLAGLYLCSGLSRISDQMDSGISALIMQQLCPADISKSALGLMTRTALAGEILLGLALLGGVRWSWLRIPAGVVAVGLHGALLFALGPLRLNHHWGVLIWNLLFVLLIPLLLAGRTAQGGLRGYRLAPAAILFSLSGLLGLADNWVGWQLYSDRPEQWELWIHEWGSERLAEPWQSWLADESVGGWRVVRLDRMSLQQTGAPLYPEDRFQLAVMERIVADSDPDLRFQILIDEPDALMWWRRRRRWIRDTQWLAMEHRRFLLNSHTARMD